MTLQVDALSLDIWFWLNEACTKDLLFGCEDLSYLLLNCIQISPVTSHNQQTLFSRHSVPLLGHSIYVRLRQQAMLLLFIKILQLKNFFVKLLFWVGCVLRLMNGTRLLWTELSYQKELVISLLCEHSGMNTAQVTCSISFPRIEGEEKECMLCPRELTPMLLPKSS